VLVAEHEPSQHVGAERVLLFGLVHREDDDRAVALDGAVFGADIELLESHGRQSRTGSRLAPPSGIRTIRAGGGSKPCCMKRRSFGVSRCRLASVPSWRCLSRRSLEPWKVRHTRSPRRWGSARSSACSSWCTG